MIALVVVDYNERPARQCLVSTRAERDQSLKSMIFSKSKSHKVCSLNKNHEISICPPFLVPPKCLWTMVATAFDFIDWDRSPLDLC